MSLVSFVAHSTDEFVLLTTYVCYPVYRDVENIEPITQADMLDFYRTYFLPSSATRAKASVHLVAQASADDIAAKTDVTEQKEKLVSTLAQMLQQLGVGEADKSALGKRLEAVDVSGGDVKGIVEAVGGYLRETAGVAAEQVEQVMQQGQVVLAQVLPTLGIKVKDVVVPDDAKDVNGAAEAQSPNETVVIEDVKAFKASMPLSAGARPVKDLSEFEELESKL